MGAIRRLIVATLNHKGFAGCLLCLMFELVGTVITMTGLFVATSFDTFPSLGFSLFMAGLCISGFGPFFTFNMSREHPIRVVVRRWAKTSARDCEAGTVNWGPSVVFVFIVTAYTTLVTVATIYKGLSRWFLLLSPLVTIAWLLLFCRPRCSGAVHDFEDEEEQGLLSSMDSENWSS